MLFAEGPPSELVAVVFRREDDIDVAGVTPNESRPDRPERRMLVGSLRNLLGDVHYAAVGMRFRHPGKPYGPGDRFTRNRPDEHRQRIDL